MDREISNQFVREPLYLDDDIIVINKPAGLLSVPGRYLKDSAVSRLSERYGDILVIHRLDQDTSGILVFARHKAALSGVQQQFEKQTTYKMYEALVQGQLRETNGCINLPIIVDWPNRPLQKISHTEGRYALTRWKKAEPKEQDSAEYSRVMLFPKTGRSHQLRIHMQQIGHPIKGDNLYAGEEAKQEPRLCLHAKVLHFNHPTSNERLEFFLEPDF